MSRPSQQAPIGAYDHRPRVVPPYQPPRSGPFRPAHRATNAVSFRRITAGPRLFAPDRVQYCVVVPGDLVGHVVTDEPGNTSCNCRAFRDDWDCPHVHALDEIGVIAFGDADESDAEGGA